MINERNIWKESLVETLAFLFSSFRMGYLLGIFTGIFLMYFFSFPRLIEKRAKDLNILHYNAKDDTFTVNDTIVLDDYEWRYLRNGKFTRDFTK